MSVNEDTINIEGPLNYLVFTQTPVNILWKDKRKPMTGILADCNDTSLTLKIDPASLSCDQIPDVGTAGVIYSSYSRRRLQFELLLKEFNYSSGTIHCERPREGLLVDSRSQARAQVKQQDCSISVSFTAQTLAGPVTFTSNKLHDFSIDSLSLSIMREQGLLLPSDVITTLEVYQDGKAIFSTTAEVFRIEPGDESNDELNAVIIFTDPESGPKYDIEPNKRRSDRVRMLNRHDAFVEFRHPLLGITVSARIMDLSISGLSILFDTDKFVLPPGLLIREASLQLPLRPRMDVELRVRSFGAEESEGAWFARVSMEFTRIFPALTKEVSEFVYRAVNENLGDSKIYDCQELWEMYFDTRFIYEGKRKQLQEYSAPILNTQRRLFESETLLLKRVIYKEHGRLLGHGLAIKIYDNVLMLQHLAAKKTHSGTVAKDIMRGMATFFLDQHVNAQNDNRYICTYFRPDNLFPSLVFGETSKLIDDSDVSWTMDFEFCLVDEQVPPQRSIEEIDCREASESDRAGLERHLIEVGDLRLLRLERWARDELINMNTFDGYAELGLYRYRRVFVAENRLNNARCFAICTYSSPGLNLSELTNSVKFVFTVEDYTTQEQLVEAVIPMVVESYSQTEMRDPVLLVRPGEPIPIGFSKVKTYTLWSMDMLYPKIFRDYLDLVFKDFRSFVKQRKAS